ncbi:MAG: hypothetical protein J6B44_05890 [Muribaculaceae bacterium]|nr:hypothetical protein [Muribaculaceae bacterium]
MGLSLTDIVGYLASICMILGYLPQALMTIRTRDTDAISMMTFSMMGLGSIFFVVNGLLWNNIPLVITNLITGTCSLIIFIIKLRNDYFKKHNKK